MPKDKSKLTRKIITDKTGKKTTVWVRADADIPQKPKQKETFNKETYDPKNKEHFFKALEDLAKEVKKPNQTPQEAKENARKLEEAIKQGKKHGHIKTEQEKEIEKLHKHAIGLSSLGSEQRINEEFINGAIGILLGGAKGVQKLAGGVKSPITVRS